MARSNSLYNQLGIGDCGHVVETWPQITNPFGHNPRVICDDCTREKYGIKNPDDQFIWVKLKEKALPSPLTGTPASKKPPRKRAPKKAKPVSAWQALLEREGL